MADRPEEQRRAEQRRPQHIVRSTEPKEEETQTYRVKEGQTWGTNPPLEAGDTVELTEAEAAGFEDKLEPADSSSTSTQGQLPAGAVSSTTETVQPPVVDDSQAGKPSVPKRPN